MSEGGDIAIDMAGGVATLRLRNPARRNAVSSAMWRAIRTFRHRRECEQRRARRGDPRRRRHGVLGRRGYRRFRDRAQRRRQCARLRRSGRGHLPVDRGHRAADPRRHHRTLHGRGRFAGRELRSADRRRQCLFRGAGGPARTRLRPARHQAIPARFRRERDVRADLHRRASARPARPSTRHRVRSWCRRRRSSASPPSGPAGSPRTPRSRSRAAKAAIRAHLSEDDAHLADAEQLYAAADASADYAEGRRAFTEKRTPRFTGN